MIFALISAPALGQGGGQAPAGHDLRAETQQELADYNADYAVTGGDAVEQAANDFAAKYPASELRSRLYLKAMHEYQNEDNPAKMLVSGRQVLALDPDNSIALVLAASVLADKLADTDTDRQREIAEIKQDGNHALTTIDSFTNSQATPAQLAAYKATLRSLDHSALGILALKTGDDQGAERELNSAVAANPAMPDPYILYHLALARDHLKKYNEALAAIEMATPLLASYADLAPLVAAERQRLIRLMRPASPSHP